jgi:hypothetical protein
MRETKKTYITIFLHEDMNMLLAVELEVEKKRVTAIRLFRSLWDRLVARIIQKRLQTSCSLPEGHYKRRK